MKRFCLLFAGGFLAYVVLALAISAIYSQVMFLTDANVARLVLSLWTAAGALLCYFGAVWCIDEGLK